MTKTQINEALNNEYGPVHAEIKPVRPAVGDVIAAFKARPGTHRHEALTVLARNFGKAVPREKLLKALYGSEDLTNVGALGMCLEGARKSIKKDNLPFRVVKENATVALVAVQ